MGMRERAFLAILEHNENIVKRKQATTQKGVFYCVVRALYTKMFFKPDLVSHMVIQV